jgi:putative peptide zinc metalloprotease protein
VARVPRPDEAGHTVVVPAAATTRFGAEPRVRSGYALKRLAVGEGPRRFVLKDLRSGAFVRMSEEDAELFALIDGSRSLGTLVECASALQGEAGPSRLALLLAALADRGFLSGTDGAAERPVTGWRRLLRPRVLPWAGAGALLTRIYDGGGRVLLRPWPLLALALVAVCGVLAFGYLVVARYGTPFVVADKVGLGAVVFVLGRLLVAALHETAHGLVMASFGRPVREAGLKFVLVFPYVYVDTSDAWFEPRGRRVAVSFAGPASDLVLGGVFAVCCLVSAAGATRDVYFQLACGAYLGAFFNLNPWVRRDGYQIAVDLWSGRTLRRVKFAWLVLGLVIAVALLVHWAL